MSEYNDQQLEAARMVLKHLGRCSRTEKDDLASKVEDCLLFREDIAAFQQRHFSRICTSTCFIPSRSWCCNREGIAVFFADMVINFLVSSEEEIGLFLRSLLDDRGGPKCVYLGEKGCVWHLKPIVCEMFLCGKIKTTVLGQDAGLKEEWLRLCRREKLYTWPAERPVLFDELEEIFIRKGCDSPLMYFHRSPGLVKVKARLQSARKIGPVDLKKPVGYLA